MGDTPGDRRRYEARTAAIASQARGAHRQAAAAEKLVELMVGFASRLSAVEEALAAPEPKATGNQPERSGGSDG